MTAPRDDASDGAARLTRDLAAHGVPCRVEARGRLALISVADAEPFGDPTTRRRVATLATSHGFTHVALELDPRSDDREALRST